LLHQLAWISGDDPVDMEIMDLAPQRESQYTDPIIHIYPAILLLNVMCVERIDHCHNKRRRE